MRLFWTPASSHALSTLPGKVSDRVIAKMDWFVQQDDPLSFAKRLAGSFAGFWRFRVGDYRVICDIVDGEIRVLRVLAVKHRSKVYGELL